MSSSPPLVVADRYRLVAPLGQGGMGRVWRATDVVLHREVAIKELVPPPGLTPGERQEMRERSLREARAIARLNNINVVRVFDVLRTDADPWIVMEYVPSRSLQDTLAADGPFSPVRAAEIGLGVLNALRAAHRAGVVHRDVKPGNVLIGAEGRVVLTDFGLATVPGDPNVTRTGLVLGSPAYIAPERARDGSAGPGADLWSLGATLYAAVEGTSPFARPSAIATLAALATENPPPARNAGPLKPVLNGLLRKDPTHRINAEEAERLLLRAVGRRSKLSFPMSPTMRRPGAGRDRTALTGGTASTPVVPGPRPPVARPANPSGRTVTPAPGRSAGPSQPPVTPGRPAAGEARPVFTPGKAQVGRPAADVPTRVDGPKVDAPRLDATRVDGPKIDATKVDGPPVQDNRANVYGTRKTPDPTSTPEAPRSGPHSSGGLSRTTRGAQAGFTAADVAANRRGKAAPEHEKSLADATALMPRVKPDEPKPDATTKITTPPREPKPAPAKPITPPVDKTTRISVPVDQTTKISEPVDKTAKVPAPVQKAPPAGKGPARSTAEPVTAESAPVGDAKLAEVTAGPADDTAARSEADDPQVGNAKLPSGTAARSEADDPQGGSTERAGGTAVRSETDDSRAGSAKRASGTAVHSETDDPRAGSAKLAAGADARSKAEDVPAGSAKLADANARSADVEAGGAEAKINEAQPRGVAATVGGALSGEPPSEGAEAGAARATTAQDADAGTENAKPEQAGSERPNTEPGGIEVAQAGAGSVETEHAGSEGAGTVSAGRKGTTIEQAGPGSAETEHAGSESAGAGQAETGSTGPEGMETEHAGADSAQSERAGAGSAQSERAGAGSTPAERAAVGDAQTGHAEEEDGKSSGATSGPEGVQADDSSHGKTAESERSEKQPEKAAGPSKAGTVDGKPATTADDKTAKAMPVVAAAAGPSSTQAAEKEKNAAAARDATTSMVERPVSGEPTTEPRPSADATVFVPAARAGEPAVDEPASMPAFRRPSRPAWTPMPVRQSPGITIFGTRLTYGQAAVAGGILLLIIVLVVVLIGVIGDRGDKGDGTQAQQPPASAGAPSQQQPTKAATTGSSPAAKPTSAAPTSAAATSPAGLALPTTWRVYTDDSGFKVPLPKSAEIRHSGSETRISWSGRLLLIDQSGDPKPDALADWKQQERDRAGNDYRNYQRVRLEPVKNYFKQAADWEFFYTTGSGNKQHAVKRNIIVSDSQAYSISWYVSPGDWAGSQNNLKLIYQGFQPKS